MLPPRSMVGQNSFHAARIDLCCFRMARGRYPLAEGSRYSHLVAGFGAAGVSQKAHAGKTGGGSQCRRRWRPHGLTPTVGLAVGGWLRGGLKLRPPALCNRHATIEAFGRYRASGSARTRSAVSRKAFDKVIAADGWEPDRCSAYGLHAGRSRSCRPAGSNASSANPFTPRVPTESIRGGTEARDLRRRLTNTANTSQKPAHRYCRVAATSSPRPRAAGVPLARGPRALVG
jgi:hypothetical protein